MSDDTTAPAGDSERRLLEALAQRYGADPFSARSAASDLAPALWLGVGIPRPDPAACGRWLRAHRSATLTGKPNRSGIVQWHLRGAAAPVAALQAPVPAAQAPAPPPARQAPQSAPAPPSPQAAPPQPRHPWWHVSTTAADGGLPGPRWACGAWWAPDAGSAP